MTDSASTGEARPGNGAPAWETGKRDGAIRLQRLIGGILVAASLGGIVLLGALLYPHPYEGVRYWAGRAAGQAAYGGLFALFVWSLLRERRPVAYLLIFGIILTGILSYSGAVAYRANRERIAANDVLAGLRTGSRDAETLSPAERSNHYVDAYLIMRDVYWELHARAEARMAHYRRLYDDYTRSGGFLDGKRLGSAYDLWYSYFQVYDLEQWLDRAESDRLEISDLLSTTKVLAVDSGTRDGYAADLRAAAAAIEETQADSIARERRTLQEMERSLKVLIDANGYFHVVGAQIIFERPEDAARFAGKSGNGNGE